MPESAQTNSTDPPAIVQLNYAAPAQPPQRLRGRIVTWLTVPVLAVPFMPFVESVSPLNAVRMFAPAEGLFGDYNPLAILGCGFFSGALAWLIRAIFSWAVPGRIALRMAIFIAAIAWCPVLLVVAHIGYELVRDFSRLLPTQFWPWLIIPVVATFGVLLATALVRTGDYVEAACAFITTSFVTNGVLCLLAFYSAPHQFGYYFTLYILLIWSGEMIWHAGRLAIRSSRLRRGIVAIWR